MRSRRTPDAQTYHGVTMDDMPGKDALTRGMNFSLFRRGKLPGYTSCKGLFGEALKAEFLRINAGQRAKSLIARDRRLEVSACVRPGAVLPPGEPDGAPGRVNPRGAAKDAPRGGP